MSRDYGQARQWLDRAAAQNDGQARQLLKAMYRRGLAADVDLEQGQDWSTRLSALFSGGARIASGSRGEVLHVVPQEGSDLISEASSGDATAQYRLAWRYRTGAWGVNKDPKKALFGFNRAAEGGNRLAMKTLARIDGQGLLGVTPDSPQAAYRRGQYRETSRF